ncbi:hypothetical protein ERO13_A07G219800v2 [Gossypium hirsutum]|uniref:Uncharacterized protein n=2 Tax=Gossypium TaxID=3633 RepID=A0A5J5V7G7_GOSBA|nr:hypothetical protein ES319_A07G238300v1 [Gossypium barbadense]KAG4193411.1 hypothetical protein ERO13_A07G219800v2 [Gossypium hirsutum]TYI20684.1 hypothetical protein ES332_A07G255900v1 [Gossypium tomentosum]KAB2075675.1 hypothetical protein ES319_A07G238300v1 [Gossypium barbadense]KAG4193412.1 hypothetical protein ERO13_A07G219800v2 [Gossypium hirsutum]
MRSEHYCKESILIPVILPSNSKPPGQTLIESLYYQMLRQTRSLFSIYSRRGLPFVKKLVLGRPYHPQRITKETTMFIRTFREHPVDIGH